MNLSLVIRLSRLSVMKNKKVTYFLLVLSVGLWGFIGWKVYAAFNFTQPEIPTVKKEPTIVSEDSVALLLNYRDPFLGKYSQTILLKDTLPKRRKSMTVSVAPKQAPTLPNVQFKGVINVGKKSMAIVQKSGKVITLKVGEEVDGFKLTKIDDSKIILSKERKRYEIPIQ